MTRLGCGRCDPRGLLGAEQYPEKWRFFKLLLISVLQTGPRTERLIHEEVLENPIFEKKKGFGGILVMVDADLAILYGMTTKALNQAVKRNKDRFSGDFMFPLTRKKKSRWSQIMTAFHGFAFHRPSLMPLPSTRGPYARQLFKPGTRRPG